jgi:hypothetical protein
MSRLVGSWRIVEIKLWEEIAALPSPKNAARLLEQLGQTRAPVESLRSAEEKLRRG